MGEINCYGIIMIGFAILLSVIAFISFSKKKMTDGCLLLWMLISSGLVFMGILLVVGGHISPVVTGVSIAVGLLLFLLIFILTRFVSELIMKTRELAMQVALLNQENESILQELNDLREKEKQ